MATLNEVMKETADAIREKKGTTELIAPVDFATEIKGITAGGGGSGESGGSNVEYWDCSAQGGIIGELSLFFIQMKYSLNGEDCVASLVDYKDERLTTAPTAISLDRSMLVSLEGTLQSAGEWLAAFGFDDFTQFGWVRITKEEFYTFE